MMQTEVHPQQRRARTFVLTQIVIASIAIPAIPIMLLVLQEPTRDHIMISIIFPIIGIIGVLLGVKSLRKMRG